MAAIWEHRANPTEAADILYLCPEKHASRYYFEHIRENHLSITSALQALEYRIDTTLTHARPEIYSIQLILKEKPTAYLTFSVSWRPNNGQRLFSP